MAGLSPALVVSVLAALVTAAVAKISGRSWGRAAAGAAFAAAAAWGADWIVAHVLAAGYPELRTTRTRPAYAAGFAIAFAIVAAIDHGRRISGPSRPPPAAPFDPTPGV